MKTAQEWASQFCNAHVVNVRGQEMQEFITAIQQDARHAPMRSLSWIAENPGHNLVAQVAKEGMEE